MNRRRFDKQEKVGGKVRRVEVQEEGLRGLGSRRRFQGQREGLMDKEKFGWIGRMFDEQGEDLRDWENVLWIERRFNEYGEGRRES